MVSDMAEVTQLTMRELGELTADRVASLDRPVLMTDDGQPVAWQAPIAPSERGLSEWLLEMRSQELSPP